MCMECQRRVVPFRSIKRHAQQGVLDRAWDSVATMISVRNGLPKEALYGLPTMQKMWSEKVDFFWRKGLLPYGELSARVRLDVESARMMLGEEGARSYLDRERHDAVSFLLAPEQNTHWITEFKNHWLRRNGICGADVILSMMSEITNLFSTDDLLRGTVTNFSTTLTAVTPNSQFDYGSFRVCCNGTWKIGKIIRKYLEALLPQARFFDSRLYRGVEHDDVPRTIEWLIDITQTYFSRLLQSLKGAQLYVTMSIDPADMLGASCWTTGWTSCYAFLKTSGGKYSTGGLAYMCDKHSAILYSCKDLKVLSYPEGLDVAEDVFGKSLLRPARATRAWLTFSPTATAAVFGRNFPGTSAMFSLGTFYLMRHVFHSPVEIAARGGHAILQGMSPRNPLYGRAVYGTGERHLGSYELLKPRGGFTYDDPAISVFVEESILMPYNLPGNHMIIPSQETTGHPGVDRLPCPICGVPQFAVHYGSANKLYCNNCVTRVREYAAVHDARFFRHDVDELLQEEVGTQLYALGLYIQRYGRTTSVPCSFCRNTLRNANDLWGADAEGQVACIQCVRYSRVRLCATCGKFLQAGEVHTRHHRYYCEEHLPEVEYRECADCGEEYDVEEMRINNDGERVCRECWSDHYIYCHLCDNPVHTDGTHYLEREDIDVCDHCYEHSDRLRTCPDCDERMLRAHMNYVERIDAYVCTDCYDELYTTCPACQATVARDTMSHLDVHDGDGAVEQTISVCSFCNERAIVHRCEICLGEILEIRDRDVSSRCELRSCPDGNGGYWRICDQCCDELDDDTFDLEDDLGRFVYVAQLVEGRELIDQLGEQWTGSIEDILPDFNTFRHFAEEEAAGHRPSPFPVEDIGRRVSGGATSTVPLIRLSGYYTCSDSIGSYTWTVGVSP